MLVDVVHRYAPWFTIVRAGARALPDETRLILYALGQQAAEGPCTQPKPWGWNIVENAKWQSWRQLGDLSGIEAMRLYIRALEDVEVSCFAMCASVVCVECCLPKLARGVRQRAQRRV